jgi:RNA polymerase sigma factor (TIGR02999 family)
VGCGVAQPPSEFFQVLLEKWKAGDQQALNALISLVYNELHGLAHHYLQGERTGHTLQTTALVNEAYLRLANQGPFQTKDRGHFVALAAQLMRQILVDYARSHRAAKRGAEWKVALDENFDHPQQEGIDVVALDDALTALSRLDPQQSRIVELRFFGGLTLEETAAILAISVSTTKREWDMAKAWLSRELRRGSDGTSGAMGED